MDTIEKILRDILQKLDSIEYTLQNIQGDTSKIAGNTDKADLSKDLAGAMGRGFD